MILCDTGPLVALLIEDDPDHVICTHAASAASGPLLTTDACLTETLHLLGRAGGLRAQNGLWSTVRSGKVNVTAMSHDARLRAAAYMDKYGDLPCDHADATLLVAAEDTGIRCIFTIDSHFYAYMLNDGSHFEMFP